MLDTIDAVAALILTQNGIAALGLATAAIMLVRRSSGKRRRID